MQEGSDDIRTGVDPGAFSLLQQKLVAMRARLDRQVSQLIRLNRVSDELLYSPSDLPVAQRFAEALVDILDVAGAVVWIFDGDEVEMGVFGLDAPQSWVPRGRSLADRLHREGIRRAVPLPDDLEFPEAALVDAIVCTCTTPEGELSALLLAANTAQMAGMYEPTSDETQEIVKLVAEKLAAYLAAIADRQLLTASEERLGLVLKGTNDGWWDWDLVTDTCFVSQRWRQMLGLDESHPETLDGFWLEWVHPRDLADYERQLKAALAGGSSGFTAEIHMRHADGSYVPVLVRGTITRGADGGPVRFTGSILDMTERHEQEQRVRRLAYFDPLTNLPNRRMLQKRLRGLLADDADGEHVVAVLMLDLDRFKTLNDTHGHAAGDQLLEIAGQRLRDVVPGADNVARLSGDEFVVILPDAGDDASAGDSARELAERIQQAFHAPFILGAGSIHHSVSIGIARAVPGQDTAEEVLKRADVAMYAAKSDGRNAIREFRPEMLAEVEERSRFEARLRKGFAAGEMQLFYQPQVDASGRLRGIEALLRWFAPDRTVISPAEVIMAAEDCGLIEELGVWSLHTACRQAAAWNCHPGMRLAVNLSASEFLHPEFPARVLSVLAATGVPGSAIQLEITEATVVSDLEFAASRMEVLRDVGIEFALDDFGTGYSSLTYLRRLPLAEVKIDRSFVTHFPDDPQDAAIIETILSLCDTLGLRVVAEGVETHRQFEALSAFDGLSFQGFLFGDPQAPPARAEDLVRIAQ